MKYIIACLLILVMACSPKTVKEAQSSDPLETETSENQPDRVDEDEIVTEEPDNERPAEMILEFQRTGCFGKCPTFIIRGFSDGRLMYHGKAFVDKVGYYEAFLPNESKQAIFQKAEQIDFFNLEDEYPSSGPQLPDLPKTKTFLKKDSLQKKVVDSFDAPLDLRQFEQFLDDYFSGLDWTKVDGD